MNAKTTNTKNAKTTNAKKDAPEVSIRKLVAEKNRLAAALRDVDNQIAVFANAQLTEKGKAVVAIFKELGVRCARVPSCDHSFRLTVKDLSSKNSFHSILANVGAKTVDIVVNSIYTRHTVGAKLTVDSSVSAHKTFSSRQTPAAISAALDKAVAVATKLASTKRQVISRMIK